MDKHVVFAAAAFALLCFGFLRWRAGVKLFFLLLVLDGAIRKWLFPEMQQLFYFLKDFLLVGTYLRFFLGERARRLVPRTHLWVLLNAAVALVVFLELLNPALPSIALGVVGLKSYLLYIPLALLMPHLFESFAALWQAVRNYAAMAIGVVILCVLQFTSGADSALNVGLLSQAGELSDQAAFHEVERVRVSGTFPFLSGLSAYLTIVLALLAALALRGAATTLVERWIIYIAGAGSLIGLFMTGSRAPVVVATVMVIVILMRSFQLRLIRERQIWLAGSVLTVWTAAVAWIFPESLGAWTARTTGSPDSILDRVIQPFEELVRVTQEAGFVGVGVGATHNAAGALIETDAVYSWLPTLAEGEMARIMLELGVLGWIPVYWARVWAIAYAWSEASRARDTQAKAVLAVISALLLVMLPAHIMVNPVANAYYYAAIGLAFAAVRFSGAAARVVLPTNARARLAG